MSKAISFDGLADALREELTAYHKDVIEKVNDAGRDAADKLKKLTKATAPKDTGSFRKNIAVKEETASATGDKKYTWHVNAPDYRKTHLLVHGHATQNGGRVPGDPFLQNALDQVLPEYEKAVEEALQ
jgi:hypothetical protein